MSGLWCLLGYRCSSCVLPLGFFVCLGVLVAKNMACHPVWSCLSVLTRKHILSMQQLRVGTRTDAAFSSESRILAWRLFWRWTLNWAGEAWRGNLRGNANFFQTLIVPRIEILCLAACLANQSCVDSNSKCILAFLFLPYCKNCLRLET